MVCEILSLLIVAPWQALSKIIDLYVFKYYILFNNTFKMNRDNSLTKYLTFNECWRRESVFIFAAVPTMDATDAFLLDDGPFFWGGGDYLANFYHFR